MSIKSGSRVGPYEVRSPLGEGAMGVVFRAHDTKLRRDVALKVLPDHLASDPDRLTRFQREGQVLASLNHPNIAQVYGLEQSGNSGCIVMELVEGETLDERIKRGPIPFDEALHIAKQIAEALEAAHERGVVHRDLKPANIKITPGGAVKVLDFGLAKALASESIDISNAKTMDSGSMVGTIVGSPGYMAPEQARGLPVDKRADIWAFGCVLYELLTGARAFDGANVTDALGAIIHREPSWERVPVKALPLLRRCLEKDPKRRLRDIGDAMPLLDQVETTAVQAPARKPWLVWITVGTAAASVVLASILAMSFFRPAPTDPNVVRFLVPPPEKGYFDTYVALSPDGRRLAFTANGPEGRNLWVRDLDKVEAQMLPGTKNAGSPFWSEDSNLIGFSVGAELRKIDPDGGSTLGVTKGESTFGVGAWSLGGVILIAQRGAGPILKVSAAGGVPSPVTALNKERGDVSHSFPSFLPDGRHFIYFVSTSNVEANGMYIGDLDVQPEEQSETPLLKTSSRAIFVSSAESTARHILYLHESNLMAQPFDVSALELRGEPTLIAEQVEAVNTIYGVFSASTNGVLAYRAIRKPLGLPVWVDRNGRDLGTPIDAPVERPEYVALSPEGKRLAIVANGALWVYDLEGKPPIKLTSTGAPATPIWTRDGRRIIFEPNTPETERMVGWLPADGSVSKIETASPEGHLHPYTWTADGKELIASLHIENPGGNISDIVKFMPGADAKLEPIVATSAREGNGGVMLSPDGRWMAYTSDTTGNTEIWVRPYGREGAPVRVSPGGGFEPLWSNDGRELFYRDGAGKVMSVVVDTRAGFDFKPATLLFEGPYTRSVQPPSWSLASNGRFLMLRPVDTAPAPITIILNWTSRLQPSK